MENILKQLEELKNGLSDTSNLKFIQQDFHRASMLSHIIGRIELVEEAVKDYQLKYQ